MPSTNALSVIAISVISCCLPDDEAEEYAGYEKGSRLLAPFSMAKLAIEV
jgi:hypothetical protein